MQNRVTGGSAYNYDDRDFTILMSGHSASQTWNFGTVSDTSWVDVGGDTSDMYWTDVVHNSDGTLTISANASGDRPMGGSFDTDITIQLPTIARASTPSAGTNPLTIGSSGASVIINTNRKSSSFTHTVTLSCGSWSTQKTGVGASSSFSVPYSVVGQFGTTSKTATCTITCVTYSGSTNIGTKTATFTLQINTSVDHPNVGTITVQDTNTRTSSVVSSGQMVSGMSTLKATIPLTVSGSYTQLASATVTCGTKSQTYSLSGTSQTITFTFNGVTSSNLKVTVKDKRGTSASGTKSWTLLGYSPVRLAASVGRPSATGSTATGKVSGVAYGGTYGSSTNSLTITVQSKLHSASSYGNTETYTQAISGNGQQSYSKSMTFSHSYSYTQQYDFKFTVSDLFSTATYVCRLMQGLPTFSWDESEFCVFGNMHIHDRSNPAIWQNVMSGFEAIMANDGIKNLLDCTASNSTVRGVTFSFDTWGRCTANGTATDGNSYIKTGEFTAPRAMDYILNGCPEGGSGTSYYVQLQDTNGNTLANDYGSGATVSLSYNTTYRVFVIIQSGVTVSNLMFTPQVRDSRLASTAFLRHSPTNRELKANAHKLDYSSAVTPLSTIRTSDWSYTAPSDGQFTSSIISTTRSYVEISINNVKVGAIALTTNSVPQAVPVSYVLSKGDTISFTGITADCHISNSYTHLIPFV